VTLSTEQLTALRNLAHKQAGDAVDWINISDAGSLTELGLAERTRDGWRITAAGLSAVETLGANAPDDSADGSGEHQIIQMRKVDDEGN
jgi:hypothetical protein